MIDNKYTTTTNPQVQSESGMPNSQNEHTQIPGADLFQQKQQEVFVQTVLPLKNKPKRKRSSCFCCFGIFFLVIVLAIISYAIVVLMNKDGIAYRNSEYDYKYNYAALTQGPWISDNDLLADFNYRKQILEEAGIPMDAEYYRQIMEMDYETYVREFLTNEINEIYNVDFGYSMKLDKAEKLKEKKEIFEISGSQYTTVFYCYLLEQKKDFEDLKCGTGMANVFSIIILTDWQYLEYQKSPIASGELLGQGVDRVYLLDHPSGLLPEEIGDITTMLEQVKSTFKVQ